jgi:hypothetical protein
MGRFETSVDFILTNFQHAAYMYMYHTQMYTFQCLYEFLSQSSQNVSNQHRLASRIDDRRRDCIAPSNKT